MIWFYSLTVLPTLRSTSPPVVFFLPAVCPCLGPHACWPCAKLHIHWNLWPSTLASCYIRVLGLLTGSLWEQKSSFISFSLDYQANCFLILLIWATGCCICMSEIVVSEERVQMAACNSCSGWSPDEMVLVHVRPGFKIVLLSMPPHQISFLGCVGGGSSADETYFCCYHGCFCEREASYAAATDICSRHPYVPWNSSCVGFLFDVL